jgi:hypothetical protein
VVSHPDQRSTDRDTIADRWVATGRGTGADQQLAQQPGPDQQPGAD